MEQKEKRQIMQSANRTLAVTLFVYLAYSYVLLFLSNVLGEWLSFLDSTAFQLVSSQLLLLVPTIFFFVKNKLSPVQFLRVRAIKPLTVFLVVIFTYAAYPLLILYTPTNVPALETVNVSVDSVFSNLSPIRRTVSST